MPEVQVKPWWQSKTIWGAIVSVIALVASRAGIPVDDAMQAELVDAAILVAGAAGAGLTVVGRLWASRPVKGGGSTALALLLLAGLATAGPIACASLAGETPAQRVYGIQADYVAAQEVAAAALVTGQVAPEVAARIKALDAEAWAAVGAARRAVRADDDAGHAPAVAAAHRAVLALSVYLTERGAR